MLDLIDSHCHLDFDAFESDRAQVVARAQGLGIHQIVIPGVEAENWPRIETICHYHPQLHPCYGLHPYLAEQHSDDDIRKLRDWLAAHECVAVGECGLDYREQQADRQVQMKYFAAQLEIAQAANKPVVIHSVRATSDVIDAIKAYPGLRGMIHSFSGSFEQAIELIKLGFYISLGGAVTYQNAKKIRATAAKLPLSCLLLETDAPDQPDAAHQDQRNEPAYLVNVLACLSELRNESAELIAEHTTANARELFGI